MLPRWFKPHAKRQEGVAVIAPKISTRQEYTSFPDYDVVTRVLGEEVDQEAGRLVYQTEFVDGHIENVSSSFLLGLDNGQRALRLYSESQPGRSDPNTLLISDDEGETMVIVRPFRRRTAIDTQSEDELTSARTIPARQTGKQRRLTLTAKGGRIANKQGESFMESQSPSDEDETDSDLDAVQPKKDGQMSGRVTRSSVISGNRQREIDAEVFELASESESSSTDSKPYLQSDVVPRNKRRRVNGRVTRTSERRSLRNESIKQRLGPTRHSERSTRHQSSMQEGLGNDVYRSESDTARPAPKAVGAREAFQAVPRSDPFSQRHVQQCEVCSHGAGAQGPLIYCQGCSLSYHKTCLGHRGSREHLVTKIGEGNFVLQCRRCVSFARRKETIAPDQGMCQGCREIGIACHPFREKKTTLQEEREREENDGVDPIVEVNASLVNKSTNVMFRCMHCWRGFHFHHLQSKSDNMDIAEDEESLADHRYREYGRDWKCKECHRMPAKVAGLIAWRPLDPDLYITGTSLQDYNEDDKEYLVKWEALSHFQAKWMSGAWVWGVAASAMRRAYAKQNGGKNTPTMRTEDAIPEDYLRIDIVLDVRFTSYVGTRVEEVDKARIRDVKEALLKFKGLGYEDAVWETVPEPIDGARWSDYVTAYDDWVSGRYVKLPKSGPLKARLDKVRAGNFAETCELKTQPATLTGGELMPYQLEGINWLYYKWFTRQNAILADEMGLGKTIQIIGLLASLVSDHNCFPFLVIVPNSTCPNWRREIKKWAPSLRVVTYYGSAAARNKAYQYELFPESSRELRCHVVVTSYDAATDDSCRRFFKSVPWQGLFVDEGQRLKSDKTLLYDALASLKIPFRVLLTGTPLQNNARELLNLLQFLDESFNAEALATEYAELTKENVPQLHALIRPFFLRRTKAQVLTFLPPMGQIIIPVSMSLVQKKLYTSILSKNADLIRAICDSKRMHKSERTNLNNILMQLRKCLCHPFVYSKEIEDRSVTAAVSHRNLVEASAKLQLLELLLPKLKERGHRVLIFSQFLDMLDIVEDFMDGLELAHQRLDGTVGSLEKQKRIDEFNAPNSNLFAFLLSTRAGGVGINLATADTVIIMDPDFNPHQDIQALSRAHRIGQKNKVLCYQLMTRASAEEKIVQIGRKKLALDHILIERMDAEEDAGVDMESILRYGAAEILEGHTQDIRYDEAALDKLLDRSQVEDTRSGEDKSAESQFSFARVWANDTASLMDSLGSDDEGERAPDPGVWEKILKDREAAAALEAAARQEALGRGKRARHTVDYSLNVENQQEGPRSRGHQSHRDSNSDTDFQAQKSDVEADQSDNDIPDAVDAQELAGVERPIDKAPRGLLSPVRAATIAIPRKFQRAKVTWSVNATEPEKQLSATNQDYAVHDRCFSCGTWHAVGFCPLKLAGAEHCNLCGLAHFGVARSCPHIRSETQVREMLETLRQSTESKHLIDMANRYLQGVKGSIVQDKKRKEEKHAAKVASMRQDALPDSTPQLPSITRHSQEYVHSRPNPTGLELPGNSRVPFRPPATFGNPQESEYPNLNGFSSRGVRFAPTSQPTSNLPQGFGQNRSNTPALNTLNPVRIPVPKDKRQLVAQPVRANAPPAIPTRDET